MFYFSLSLLLVNAFAFVFAFARINECSCYHHSPTTNTSTRTRTRTRTRKITGITTSTPPTSHPSSTSTTMSRSSSSSSSLAMRGIRINGLHTAAVDVDDADVIHKVDDDNDDSLWDSINALTLFTNDMAASCLFYQKLGLYCTYGGTPDSMFSTFSNNDDANNATFHINLELNPHYKKESNSPGWGRCVFHVQDVDALYEKAMNAGLQPEFAPTDANWGERYFQILDPMGHEISLAKRIEDHPRWN